MANEPFTLIVVPGPEGEIRRFRGHPRQLKRAIAFCVVLMLGAAAAVVHLWSLSDAVGENELLRKRNQAMRALLGGLRERVQHLDTSLSRVARFDQRLRGSTSLSDPERTLAVGPTEGSRPSDALLEESSRRQVPESLDALSLTADAYAREAQETENSLQQLQAYFQEQSSLLASTPSIWPLRGDGVTSTFGTRADPFTFQAWNHAGLDIGGPMGKEIVAPSNGVVVFAALEGGYGNVIVIDHGHGIKTRYGHLSAFKVKPGDKVRRGQPIGAVGTTGHSTGPHLHYEVRVNGAAQDPRKFILEP